MCVSERYFGKMTNPYTLNHLYSQGILDYVPYDLCSGAVVSPMMGMQNPYMNAAQQGALYQNHGMYGDTVEFNLGNQNIGAQSQAGGVNALGFGNIGTQSQAGGVNALGFGNIGTQSQAGGVNALGFGNIGAQSQAGGANALGFGNIGTQSQAGGANAWGGFNDAQNGVSKAAATFNSIPNFVKGVAAGFLMIGSLALVLKRGKKPVQVEKQGFFSKLNPFKKK